MYFFNKNGVFIKTHEIGRKENNPLPSKEDNGIIREMMITLEERYKNFKDTIKECGSYLLFEDDDTIKHNLFEEFSVDVASFLHEDTLKLLVNEGIIDSDILEKSIELRKLFMKLEKTPDLLSVEAVKTDDEWKSLFRISDEIGELLYW